MGFRGVGDLLRFSVFGGIGVGGREGWVQEGFGPGVEVGSRGVGSEGLGSGGGGSRGLELGSGGLGSGGWDRGSCSWFKITLKVL